MSTPTEIPLSADTLAVAKWIWHNLVPKSGQCTTVQGELLRAVEKLSWEAETNGNVNWDSGFEILADYLERTLCGDRQLGDEMRRSVRKDLRVLRDYEHPYTEDDLYDRLVDAVVAYCRLHPQLLPKPVDPLLHR
jgi:hypothetical protein